jgi:hypothetical protein
MPRRATAARLLAAFAAVAMLAACADEAPPQSFTPRPFDYAHLTPLRLDVARVEVVEAYRPPRVPPNMDHRAPIEPRVALAQMARDRVQAWGRDGVATVTITDASLVETRLDPGSGIASLFAAQPSERYTLNLAITLDVQNGGALRGGGINGRAEARISRTRTLNDDATLADRERAWDEMLRQAMDDARGMNVEFEFQVRQALRSLLVPEGTVRPDPSAVEVQDLGAPGAAPPAQAPSSGPRELTPSAPVPASPLGNPAAPPPGLQPGPGGTPGMGTLGTMPVQR